MSRSGRCFERGLQVIFWRISGGFKLAPQYRFEVDKIRVKFSCLNVHMSFCGGAC